MSQTTTGWKSGSYTLTFSAAQRGNLSHGGQNLQVLIDGKVVGVFKPSSTNYLDYSATFAVTGSTHTLTFISLDSAGGDNTAFIDNIRLAAKS